MVAGKYPISTKFAISLRMVAEETPSSSASNLEPTGSPVSTYVFTIAARIFNFLSLSSNPLTSLCQTSFSTLVH